MMLQNNKMFDWLGVLYIVERKRDERKNIEGKKNLGENERKLI